MKIKRKPVMAASGDVQFTNDVDAIYDSLKNLEFNTPDASMFVDVVRKPRYAVRVETEHTLEDGNAIADETFYIFKSDDGRIKAVFEDQNPRAFIDRDAVVTFIRDYWKDRGFDLTGGVASSTRTTKRPIKAAAEGHDPWSLIEQDRAKVIKEWSETYDGTPNTSWDNIFDNVLEDFKRYADDEASGNILDDFIESNFDEYDMLTEFYQFIMLRDMNDYDF
jgi:hypothetical protein